MSVSFISTRSKLLAVETILKAGVSFVNDTDKCILLTDLDPGQDGKYTVPKPFITILPGARDIQTMTADQSDSVQIIDITTYVERRTKDRSLGALDCLDYAAEIVSLLRNYSIVDTFLTNIKIGKVFKPMWYSESGPRESPHYAITVSVSYNVTD